MKKENKEFKTRKGETISNLIERAQKVDNQVAKDLGMIEKPRCSKCGSTLTYVRIKTQELVCRQCGHIEKIEDKKEDLKNG